MSSEKPNPIEEHEPIREILTRVGDKWTIVILTALREKRMRFTDLHRAGQGISQRVLTASLRSLERDGLLLRTVYPTVPPRVEYELSERGHSLREVLDLVGAWMATHRPAIEMSRRRFDSERESQEKPELIRW
ncbi:MAG: helix-turn-helix domain-containing protein [Methylocella sp.]